MSIIRVSKRERFVVMDKTGLEDSRLSFKTKGVLAYLLSKPDDWTINYRQLEKVGPDGKALVLAALKELEDYCYLTRERTNTPDGFQWEQVLYEYPMNRKPEHGADQGKEGESAGQAHEPVISALETGASTEECLTEKSHAPKIEQHYEICDACGCAVLERDLEAHKETHEVAS